MRKKILAHKIHKYNVDSNKNYLYEIAKLYK